MWLDIFAVNQHPGQEQVDDLSSLQLVIKEAKQTLLIMDSSGQVCVLFADRHEGNRDIPFSMRWRAQTLRREGWTIRAEHRAKERLAADYQGSKAGAAHHVQLGAGGKG